MRFPIESDRETAKQIGASLASTYQTAVPYPHIRLDDFIEPEALEAVIKDLKNARAPEASSHDRDQERNKLSYHPDTLPADTRSPSSAPAHRQTRWDGWTLAEYLGDRCEAFLPRVRTVHAYVRDAIALADELEWAYHVVPTR